MPNPTPFLLLLLLLSLSTTTTTTSTTQRFKEAPQYYNSPDCPTIPDATLPCSTEAIHVAMTLDETYLRGSLAAILSILQHSTCPENTFFHLITSSTSKSAAASPLRATLTHSFPSLHFHLYPFNTTKVSHLISTSLRPALDNPLNHARPYLPSLLPPCLPRVIYLDSDVLLFSSLSQLFSTPLGPSSVLAAPEYCHVNFTSYFTPSFWSHPSLPLTFSNRVPCYFNTGVMVIDLVRWRGGEYTRRIEEWMEVQKRVRIYELGSLPPFLLVFGGEIVAVDRRWNQHGLGGDNYKGVCRDLHPGPVSLLHWSGKGKPWARLDAGRPCPLDALWAPFDLLDTTTSHHSPLLDS